MRSTIFRSVFLIFALLFGSVHAAHADEILVSAAASLTNAFQEIGKAYEAKNPGTKVVFNFAASGALLQQIAQGAPVDVFASADEETMDKAQQQNLIVKETRADFVGNKLVLVVPITSTFKLSSVHDLTQPVIKGIAIGTPTSVPVGRYTKSTLEAAGLWTALEGRLINAENVRQVLAYVARGEVEAGFVYSSDVGIEKDKVKIALDVPTPKPVIYPIARISASTHAVQADAFIAWVRSPAGQEVLLRYGFSKL